MSGGAQFLILAIEELETCTRPGIRLGFTFGQTSEGLVEVDRGSIQPTGGRSYFPPAAIALLTVH